MTNRTSPRERIRVELPLPPGRVDSASSAITLAMLNVNFSPGGCLSTLGAVRACRWSHVRDLNQLATSGKWKGPGALALAQHDPQASVGRIQPPSGLVRRQVQPHHGNRQLDVALRASQ